MVLAPGLKLAVDAEVEESRPDHDVDGGEEGETAHIVGLFLAALRKSTFRPVLMMKIHQPPG
jgi:hypothetical protein